MGSSEKSPEKKGGVINAFRRLHSKSNHQSSSPNTERQSKNATDTSSVLSTPSSPSTPNTPTNNKADRSLTSKMKEISGGLKRSNSRGSHSSLLKLPHLSPHGSNHPHDSPSSALTKNRSASSSVRNSIDIHSESGANGNTGKPPAPAEANGSVIKQKQEPDEEADSDFDEDDEDDEDDEGIRKRKRASSSSRASVMSDADSIDGTKISKSRVHSVMLAEAAEDTPSFRASVEFLDVQLRSLDQWLSDFAHKSDAVVAQLGNVKDSVNQLIKIFMPSVTHGSILAQDYTTLLFGRYTEATSIFWSELVAQVTRSANEIRAMVKHLQEGCFKQYKEARVEFLKYMNEQTNAMANLMRLPQHSEPAALREATFKAYKARKNFLKASTNLVMKISDLEGETTVSLLESLSSQSLPSQSDFFGYSQSRLEMSIEFHRLQSVAISLRSALPGISNVLKRMRRNLLKSIKTERPPKDLQSYHEAELLKIENHPPEKTGWVNVEVKPGTWVLLWGYLRNGLFGFLGTNPSRTAVVESARFAVHSCQFELVEDEDRRCLFRVKNHSQSVLVQSTSPYHLAQWKAAFEASRALHGGLSGIGSIENSSISRMSSNSDTDASLLLLPWNQSFAIPEWSLGISAGAETVSQRIRGIRNDINGATWLEYNSTLTSKETNFIGSTVPSVKPLPTAVPLEAVVANTFFKPVGVPNAIIGNIWGSLGDRIIMGNQTVNNEIVHYSNSFTAYPENYPKGLAVQDMDMRAITAQLPPDEAPEDDDFLLFFLRGTSNMRGNEAPSRIYVTSRKLIMYTSWQGLISLQSFDIKSVLEVDTTHGVDWSDLRINVHVPNVKNEVRIIPFRLYIDSGTLAKRRLLYVVENVRCRVPKPSRELLEPLVLLGIEYADAVKADETRMESDLVSKLGGDKDIKLENKGGNSITTLLLRRSIGTVDTRGEDTALETGKGMQSKIAEDTFPINAEALFCVLFGPKSPVFSGHHSAVIDTDNTVGPWYRKGKRIERRIAQKFLIGGGESSKSRYNYQKIDRQERNWYVVAEKRSPLEMPSGDQFYSIVRYVIYSTEQGCHLQIWTRIVWMTARSSHANDEIVLPILKMSAQETVMRVRQAADKVHSLEDAQRKFGKLKVTKVLNSKDNDSDEEAPVTRVSGKSMALIIAHSPIFSLYRLRWFLLNLFYCLFKLSSPKILLILVLIGSLLSNIRLYKHSSAGYWEAYLDHQSTNDFISTLKLLPGQSSSVFQRSVYTKDIDDLIANGSLWQPPVNTVSVSETGIEVEGIGNELSYGCSAKFSEIARLGAWASEFGSLYEFEPRAKEAMERISDVRYEYAILRNEMMTMLRVLNTKEREELDREYRAWLISETAMCSQVRSTVHMLNATVLEEIKSYCLNCLEEAKGLY